MKLICDFNNIGIVEFRGIICYVFVCNDGFERSGFVFRNDKLCWDIDECIGNVYNCDIYVFCKNIIGFYEFSCINIIEVMDWF